MFHHRKSVALVGALLLTALPALATVHTVTVQNFSFTPRDLTVAQGDTVVWNCTSGTHNVHELSTPAVFYSGDPRTAPWQYTFVFNVAARTYDYWCDVHAPGMAGTVTVQASSAVGDQGAAQPERFGLDQNFPNPFNSRTTIRFSVPFETDARISVLNILGQKVGEVFAGRVTAGDHSVSFDASGLAGGLYFYRLETPAAVLTRTMLYLK
jgi:plastocyanin